MAGEAHESNGAGEGFRTPDLLITNQLLYQLSYASSRAPPVRAAPRTGHSASPEKAHKLKPPPAGGDQGPILANSGGGVKKLCTPRGGLAAGPNGPFRGPIDKDPPRSMGGPPMRTRAWAGRPCYGRRARFSGGTAPQSGPITAIAVGHRSRAPGRLYKPYRISSIRSIGLRARAMMSAGSSI